MVILTCQRKETADSASKLHSGSLVSERFVCVQDKNDDDERRRECDESRRRASARRESEAPDLSPLYNWSLDLPNSLAGGHGLIKRRRLPRTSGRRVVSPFLIP